MLKGLAVTLAVAGALVSQSASAEEMIKAEVLNFSEMDRWVQVTDMNCKTVLYKDKLPAQGTLPVEICADESGKGKLQFYIRIGCTKNQTVVRKDIEAGSTVSF